MEKQNNFYKQDVEKDKIWINKEYLIQLNLTGKCKMNCDFCYIKKDYSNDFLSVESIEKLWVNLRKYYYENNIDYRVNITGGDVFEHPQYLEIAEFIANEKSITAVDPLINKFWNEENKQILSILKDKINFVQFNSDIVSDEDILLVKNIDKKVVLKVSLYQGNHKKEIEKIKYFMNKYDNIIVSIDLIIPQLNNFNKNENFYLFNNYDKLKEKILDLKEEFGERLWLLCTTVKRIVNNEIYYCPVPFGGVYIMPDNKIVPCSRYPHLETGFTIDNFDLMDYVNKYNKLTSNFCLFENKYFEDFWDKTQNPIEFIKNGK